MKDPLIFASLSSAVELLREAMRTGDQGLEMEVRMVGREIGGCIFEVD